MTVQEAYALSAERQANLEYRHKIQRIKNTLLGVLAGGVLGGVSGTLTQTVGRSALDKLLGRPGNKTLPVVDAVLGSAIGGAGGYSLARLQELLDKPDDLGQALKTIPGTPSSVNENKELQNLEKEKEMTQKEAYIKGFRKVAETNGVDPERLAKFAQWKTIGRGFSRFGNLLLGGHKATLKSKIGKIEDAIRRASAANQELAAAKIHGLPLTGEYQANAAKLIEGVKGTGKQLPSLRNALDKESLKVLGARAGVIAPLGYMGYRLAKNDAPEPPRPYYYPRYPYYG